MIENFTDQELKAELWKRSEIARAASIHPSRLDTIDWNPLIKMVEEAEAKSAADGFEDDDTRQYIYEAVMTAIYGPDYFTWRKKQRW